MTTWQPQGPADRCVIDGRNMGWLNCTPESAAMGIDWASHGLFDPSGCSVRRRTGDTTGGMTLAQVEPVINEYGIETERRTSFRYASPALLAERLQDPRIALMGQGNTGVLIGTRHQSTAGYVNHCVWVQDPKGWRRVNGLYRPDTVLVFDPAADGRYDFAQGPQRWSWATFLRFCAALRPNGDSDPVTIGPGKAWVMFLTQLPGGDEMSNWAPGMPFAVTLDPGTDTYDEDGNRVGEVNTPTKPFLVVGESSDGTRYEIAGHVTKSSPKRFVDKAAVNR